MALEIQSTSMGKAGTRPAGIAPADMTLPEEVLANLQLPEDITPQQVIDFLSLQSSRLQAIESSQRHYSDYALVPPPSQKGMKTADVEINEEQLQSIEELVQELASEGKMGAQAGDTDAFRETSQKVLEELRKRQTTDVFGDGLLDGMISQEADEIDRRYEELIQGLIANKNVDVATVLVAIGHYLSEKYGTKLQESVMQFHAGQEAYQKQLAAMDLGKPGGLSPTEMLQAQWLQGDKVVDNQMGMQQMQFFLQELQKSQTTVKSFLESEHRTRASIIQNFRVS